MEDFKSWLRNVREAEIEDREERACLKLIKSL